MNRFFGLAEQTFAAKDTSVEHIERSSNVAGPA